MSDGEGGCNERDRWYAVHTRGEKSDEEDGNEGGVEVEAEGEVDVGCREYGV